MSWQRWQVLQNLSTFLSIPGHHTFDCNLCFMLTIPGCPSWVRESTWGLNFLGMTILVFRRINFPITHSSLHTGVYCLCWSPFHFPFLMHWRNSTNSLSSDEASSLLERLQSLRLTWQIHLRLCVLMKILLACYDYFAECEIGVKWANANSLAWSIGR